MTRLPELKSVLAERFTDLGYATWNVEYRHTGDHAKDKNGVAHTFHLKGWVKAAAFA